MPPLRPWMLVQLALDRCLQACITRTTDHGPRATDRGPRTVDRGPRAVDPGPRTVDPGPRTADRGPRAAVPGSSRRWPTTPMVLLERGRARIRTCLASA